MMEAMTEAALLPFSKEGYRLTARPSLKSSSG
jgi:hypothetical protein